MPVAMQGNACKIGELRIFTILDLFLSHHRPDVGHKVSLLEKLVALCVATFQQLCVFIHWTHSMYYVCQNMCKVTKN